MRTPGRLVALGLSCVAAAAPAGGCEDSQARRRVEVQEMITSATRELAEVTALRADSAREPELQQKLNGVIDRLSDTNGGEPGQRAAASRLAASAHHTLAAVAATRANRLEAEHRTRRALMEGMIDAALELDVVAAGLESFDTEAQRQRLDLVRQDAQDQLREHNQKMAELDTPIADLESLNRNDQDQADRLRQEADRLRREADDLGPMHGYPLFEQSLQLDRQADRIELEIAQRELELHLIFEPEHKMARMRADHAQSRSDNAEAASQGLTALAGDVAGEATTTRTDIVEAGRLIAQKAAEIEQSTTGELADLYEQAAEDLEQAASKSGSAAGLGRDDSSEAAKLEAARAQQQLGNLRWDMARGLAAHLRLRRRLDDASEALGDVSSGLTSTESLRQKQNKAQQQAVAAYTEALETLGTVRGRAARRQLESLKANITLLQSAAAGEEINYGASAGNRAHPAGPARPGSGAAGGAESPEALVDAFMAARGDPSAGGRLFLELTYIETRTPSDRKLYESMIETTRAHTDLEQTLKDQFGTTLASYVAELGGAALAGAGWTDFLATVADEVKLGEVSGSAGEMIVSISGVEKPVPLKRVNGRWFIDGSDILQRVKAMVGPLVAAAEGQSPVDMVVAIGRIQTSVSEDFSRRVRAGEFTSFNAFFSAYQTALMQKMSDAAPTTG